MRITSDDSFFSGRKRFKRFGNKLKTLSFPFCDENLKYFRKLCRLNSSKINNSLKTQHFKCIEKEIEHCIKNGKFGKKPIYPKSQFKLEELDSGFYANVCKATNKINKKVVVVKFFKREEDRYSSMCELFLFRMISHKNIVRLLGACLDKNTLYPVFEYIDGGALEDYYMKHKPDLSWSTKVSLTSDVADALYYLHSCSYIHRDITSRNVLIKKTNSKIGISAILIDLGLAIPIPTKRNKSACTVVGSPFFMAPEVLRCDYYNEKADVFSFGIVISSLMAQITADPEYLPRTMYYGVDYVAFSKLIKHDCPPDYLNLIFNCCQVRPDKRPSFKKVVGVLNNIKRLMHNELTMVVLSRSKLRNVGIMRSINPFCLIKYRYEEGRIAVPKPGVSLSVESKKKPISRMCSTNTEHFKNISLRPFKFTSSPQLYKRAFTVYKEDVEQKKTILNCLKTPLAIGEESAKLDEYYKPKSRNPFNLPMNYDNSDFKRNKCLKKNTSINIDCSCWNYESDGKTKLHFICSSSIYSNCHFKQSCNSSDGTVIANNLEKITSFKSPSGYSNSSFSQVCPSNDNYQTTTFSSNISSSLTRLSLINTTADSAVFTLSANPLSSTSMKKNMSYVLHPPLRRLCTSTESIQDGLVFKNCLFYKNKHPNADAASIIMVNRNYSKINKESLNKINFSNSLDSLQDVGLELETRDHLLNDKESSNKFKQLMRTWTDRQNTESQEEVLREKSGKLNASESESDQTCNSSASESAASFTSTFDNIVFPIANRLEKEKELENDVENKILKFKVDRKESTSSCSSVKFILDKFESKNKNG